MKRLITLTALILLASATAFSQSKEGTIYTYVEQMPEPGFSIPEYMTANLTYPANAQAAKIEGKVVLKFIVNEEGGLDSIHVIRPLYPSIDSTALALIQKMPKWKPAMQSGKAVKVYYTLPVIFKLQPLLAGPLDVEPVPPFNIINYLADSLKYPLNLKPENIRGKVSVEYAINVDGTLTDIKIVEPLHPLLDAEALRLVRAMPKWKPGMKDKKPIRSLYTLPVYFDWLDTSRSNSPAIDQVHLFVETMPEPLFNISEYLSKNMRYPDFVKEQGIKGRVVIKFVLDENGYVSEARLARSVHPVVDNEALRVVLNMPKWKPGEQNGKPVKVYFTIPILFNVQ